MGTRNWKARSSKSRGSWQSTFVEHLEFSSERGKDVCQEEFIGHNETATKRRKDV
jgi:hypothetical protein